MSQASSIVRRPLVIVMVAIAMALVALVFLRLPQPLPQSQRNADDTPGASTSADESANESTENRNGAAQQTTAALDDGVFKPVVEWLAHRNISRALRELRTIEKANQAADSSTAGAQAARIALLRATCYSHLRMQPQVEASLAAARQAGVAIGAWQQVERLTLARAGRFEAPPRETVRSLITIGVEENEARSAVILGAAQQPNNLAQQILDESSTIADSERAYLRGLIALGRSDYVVAEEALRKAIELEPQHEPAHSSLVELSESPVGSLESARRELQRMQERFPDNALTALRLVRVLRKLGDCQQARELLPLADNTELHPLWLVEKAELDFDQARYDDATTALSELGLSTPEQFQQLVNQAFVAMTSQQGAIGEPLFRRASLGGLSLVFSGQSKAGQQVFEDVLDRVGRLRRIIDLNRRQAALGTSPDVESELARLLSANSKLPKQDKELANDAVSLSDRDTSAAQEVQRLRGRTLYADLCVHCHGQRGDGQGRAARHLFPLPRNFLQQRMHFVTATNGRALDADIARTIHEGLQGTSMPAYRQLSDSDVAALVVVVRDYQRVGARDKAMTLGLVGDELEDVVQVATGIHAEPLAIPAEPSDRNAAIENGRTLFQTSGCAQCHRSQSPASVQSDSEASTVALVNQVKDVAPLVLFDEAGEPTVAPDLITHRFKGGQSLAAIYARLKIGIPGTPHPALAVAPEQLLELACYVQSLPTAAYSEESNHQRRRRVQATR